MLNLENKNKECVLCKNHILDKICLQTKDGFYHVECLRCQECNLELNGQLNCYNRNGVIYCKNDYERLFHQSIKVPSSNVCTKCGLIINNGQLIQRPTFETIYHLKCFKCSICNLILQPGQRFTFIKQTTELICELHLTLNLSTNENIYSNNKNLIEEENTKNYRYLKNKRNRTSFKLNQMAEMKAFFEENQNPDSNQLSQLSKYIKLSTRVLRVWFQNQRAKSRRNFLQQKSIGPLVVPEVIKLEFSNTKLNFHISGYNQHIENLTDNLNEFCQNITKQNQYDFLIKNLKT